MEGSDREYFGQAVEFLYRVRCFLHYRHERDDNTLDWQAQDAGAESAIGLTDRRPKKADAAYWMRFYFRRMSDGVELGFSQEEWESLKQLFRDALATSWLKKALSSLSLAYGEL